jgi:UPF0755 protein
MRRAFKWPLIGAAGVVGLAVVLLIAAWLFVTSNFDTPGPLRESQTIVLADGLGAWTIADQLAAAGIVGDATLFAAGVWLEGEDRSLKAGEYEFAALVTPRGVMEKLITGQSVARRITIAEGLTSAEAVVKVNEAEGLVGEVTERPQEGSLLPETYHYARGDSRTALIARMQSDMDRTLDELWAGRDVTIDVDTVQQAVVLASIVEKETGVAEERPLIAGVFLNRLRKGMRLQSDPTVIYALTEGRETLGRPLSRADLKVDSPYNTYRYEGLPPGPIANPGRAAIDAVLHPAETDALYFVADGTGGHAFAKTLDEHNRNVARWRALREKGQ